ncbi:MAG: 7-carboxy-7-deazaguanine synthase QueE [Candidatus Omnitrophota bacterium]
MHVGSERKVLKMLKSRITEIFSSIQGEGIYVGEEHLFIRFHGCNLSCGFCDEREKDDFLEYTAWDVFERVIKEGKNTVSLTGGEPLLQVDFLEELLPLLKNKDFRTYLETNGILKDNLIKVLDYIDIIAMDIKLPTSTGEKELWDEHKEFLKVANKKEVFIKAVLTENTLMSDVDRAIRLVREVDKKIPFIIQPVSYNGSMVRIDSMKVFFDRAKRDLDIVRIVPQIHKLLGVR